MTKHDSVLDVFLIIFVLTFIVHLVPEWFFALLVIFAITIIACPRFRACVDVSGKVLECMLVPSHYHFVSMLIPSHYQFYFVQITSLYFCQICSRADNHVIFLLKDNEDDYTMDRIVAET